MLWASCIYHFNPLCINVCSLDPSFICFMLFLTVRLLRLGQLLSSRHHLLLNLSQSFQNLQSCWQYNLTHTSDYQTQAMYGWLLGSTYGLWTVDWNWKKKTVILLHTILKQLARSVFISLHSFPILSRHDSAASSLTLPTLSVSSSTILHTSMVFLHNKHINFYK